MRFEEPLWLLAAALVAAAALAGYHVVEGRRASLAFPDGAAMGAMAASTAATALWRALPYAMKSAALLLCVAAMARPQRIQERLGGVTQGIDIMLAIDTSGSMRALDFDPLDRITAAKQTAARFVGGRTADRIGALVFGGAPLLVCPLTLDYGALVDTIGDMEADMTHVDGTAIGDAIASGVNHLRTSKAKSRIIILLTDGRSNTGVIDPLTAAKTAQSFGIKIYTIGTAKRGRSVVPVTGPRGERALVDIDDDIDEDILLKLAALTDGKYFRATSLKELKGIYDEIDRLEKTEIDRPRTISYHDLFPRLLWPAAALLLLELTLSTTALLRLP